MSDRFDKLMVLSEIGLKVRILELQLEEKSKRDWYDMAVANDWNITSQYQACTSLFHCREHLKIAKKIDAWRDKQKLKI